MLEIRTATAAVTAAQTLIDADTSAAGTDLWQSYAVSPLAAVLLSTAHDNAGCADLGTVRDLLTSPASEPDGQPHPGWVSVAQRCPDPLLSSALLRAAGLEQRQRDSFRMSALAALARS